MQPIANRSQYLAALQFGHSITCTAQIRHQGSLTGPKLNVISGTVTMDAQATYLSTCDIVLAPIPINGPSKSPSIPTAHGGIGSDITPWGNEIQIWRSIDGYGTVSLGIFRISEVIITDDGNDLTIEVQGYDRSFAVAIQGFTDQFVVKEGTDFNTAIYDIVTPRFIGFSVPIAFAKTSAATTTQIVYGVDQTDPWSAAWDLARRNGNRLYFDPNGVLKQAPWAPEGPKNRAVDWSLSANDTSSIFTSVTRTLTTTPLTGNATYLPNEVIIFGESSTAGPARKTVSITSGDSPIAIPPASKYGVVPLIIQTNKVQSDLTTYATNTLLSYAGQDEQVTITCVENPLLEVNDVIYLFRSESGVHGNYVVSQIVHALEPQTPMQIMAYRSADLTNY